VADYIALLIQGLALGLAAAASPGPFQTYLINQSLVNGFRRAAPVAFAPLIADIPIVLASLLLLDQLPPEFLRFLNIAGGLFVLYLAYNLWKSWHRNRVIANTASAEASHGVHTRSLGRGVIMNLLSPGPYTFWFLVTGPILLSALRRSPFSGLAFLLGFYAALIGGFLCIAALFHQARRLGPVAVHWLSLASIMILFVFGLILIKRGIWG
jgi:threonine/homoserine/homoserine lactone efflux protein